MGMGLAVTVILIVFGLLFVPYLLRRRLTERRLIERRLSLKAGSQGDAKLLAMRFADIFNDEERIRQHLAKDSELARAMWQAGFRSSNQRAILFGVQVVLPLGTAVIVALWVLGQGMSQNVLMTAAAVIILSILMPKRFVVGRAEKRLRNLNDELSLFMQMLRILFDAGLAVEQALRVLVDEAGNVLPETVKELAPILWRSDQGLSLEEELQTAAQGMDDPGFTDVCVVLRQMLKQGGSARASLAKMIEVMDSRRLTDMQEKVSKLSAKMTVVMVVFFFPALIILIAGPGLIAIGNTLGGS